MAQRLKLHQLLETLSDNVYFQPPPNISLSYPCIIYNRDTADIKFADDIPYSYMQRYTVLVIDKDPDGVLRSEVASLPRVVYDRFFTADNLNHDVFSLYF